MRFPRWLVVLAPVVVLAVAGTLVTSWLRPSPPGDFYAASDSLADASPGDLLRIEPFDAEVQAGSRAWRVLYASRDRTGAPIAVSGIVLAPDVVAIGPRPVLAIAHGSTGIDPSCAPSLSARPFASAPGVEEALADGWVVVVPDYPGLGTLGPHPYLVGRATGHALVDGIRAAGGLVGVDASRSAVWGYSQGGHAALFAIEEAATIEDVGLVGAVLFAPATDLAGLIDAGQGTVAGTLMLVTAAVSWSEVYPELALEDVVATEAVDEAREIAARCLTATSLPASIVQSIRLRDVLVDIDDPRAADWARAVADNTPSAPLDVPVLVFHGDDDLLISSEVTREFVAERCRRGDPIEMRMVSGAGHFTLVSRTVDDAATWTRARLRGEPPTYVCPPPDEEPSPDLATGPEEDPGDGGQDDATDDARGVGPLGARARPDWLGTQVLPRSSTGFGEVRATPAELVDRRLVTPGHLPPPPDGAFRSSIRVADAEVLARSTWHEGCPVAADELRYVTVTFRGFDGRDHTGELLVHEDEAAGIVEVFGALHAAAFPIEEMRIVRADELDAPPTGDGNNTTGFVCRSAVSGSSWSEHAFGRAIDLNPFHNPYVRGEVVLPELASAYLDRDHVRPGMIGPDDVVVQAFAGIGWRWGGDWQTSLDWMHFSTSGR